MSIDRQLYFFDTGKSDDSSYDNEKIIDDAWPWEEKYVAGYFPLFTSKEANERGAIYTGNKYILHISRWDDEEIHIFEESVYEDYKEIILQAVIIYGTLNLIERGMLKSKKGIDDLANLILNYSYEFDDNDAFFEREIIFFDSVEKGIQYLEGYLQNETK